jgi:RNA ligase (TIGR02306 family)
VIGIDHKIAEDGLDLTEKLGVIKYDPELQQNVFKGIRPENLQALPTTVHRYDIESLQRYPGIYEALKEEVVHITEKLEGSHWWARIDKDGLTLHVGQRNFEIKRGDEMDKPHPFWSALYDESFDDLLYWLAREMPGYDITIRGEIIGAGIQGNYYGLPGRKVYLFELELNGEPITSQQFFDLMDSFRSFLDIPVFTVPQLSAWNTLGELFPSLEVAIAKANGKSKINGDKLREGIVIKPALKEMYNVEIGRLFIKVRDKEYLGQ